MNSAPWVSVAGRAVCGLGCVLLLSLLVLGCARTGRVVADLGFADLEPQDSPELRARCTCCDGAWKQLGRGGAVDFRMTRSFAERTAFADGSCEIIVDFRNSMGERDSTHLRVKFPDSGCPVGVVDCATLHFKALDDTSMTSRRHSHEGSTSTGKVVKETQN